MRDSGSQEQTQRQAERSSVMDSGSSSHMIGNKLITKSEQKTIRKLLKAFPAQTANKVVYVSREVKVFIKTLNVYV